MEARPGPYLTSTVFGAAACDAAGGWSSSASLNTDGTFVAAVDQNLERSITESIADGGRFSVASDGALSLTYVSGAACRGGIAPDGRFAVAAGGAADGDDPRLIVMIRR